MDIEIKENERIDDLEYKNLKKVTGIEVQAEIAEMAERSIKLNNLQDRFNIVNENIKNIPEILEKNSYDYIITNPPYKKINTGKTNDSKLKLISRHEVEASLEDFINVSYKMLKDKGTLFMVHRPDRLVDILYTLRKNKMEPKKINKEANLVLIKAVKNGKEFLTIEKPLYVYNEDGSYTDDILKIYNKID